MMRHRNKEIQTFRFILLALVVHVLVVSQVFAGLSLCIDRTDGVRLETGLEKCCNSKRLPGEALGPVPSTECEECVDIALSTEDGHMEVVQCSGIHGFELNPILLAALGRLSAAEINPISPLVSLAGIYCNPGLVRSTVLRL
jgi:hypothetical protein